MMNRISDRPFWPLLFALSLLAALSSPESAWAQQSAMIDGANAPYTLVDAQYEQGRKAQAIRVTGSAGYASIPDTATVVQPASFAIEAFVKLEAPGSGSDIIAVRRGPKSQAWQFWCTNKGMVAFQGYAADSKPVGMAKSNKFLTFDQWHHVCVSVDENLQASLYIDGELDSQAAFTGPVNTSARSAIPVYVGGAGIADRIFPGLVEDFRFYSGAVTPERLAAVKAMLAASAKP